MVLPVAKGDQLTYVVVRMAIRSNALLLCLVLGAAMATVPAMSQGLPTDTLLPDLDILSVDASAGPWWEDGLAQEGALQVTVVNRGGSPVAYELKAFWKGSSGVTDIVGTGSEAELPVMAPLIPGDPPRQHEVRWLPFPEQKGEGAVIVEVVPVPEILDAVPENNQETTIAFVPVHHLTMAATGSSSEIPINGTGFARFTVRNHGNVPETTRLTVDHLVADSRLRADIHPKLLNLLPNHVSNVTVYVDYRPAGNFTPFSVQYLVTATTESGTTQSALTTALTNGSAVETPAGHAFVLGRQSNQLLVAARGAETAQQLVLRNTGIRPDNYTLTAPGQSGWTVRVEPTRAALLPGEQTPVQFFVRPDAAQVAGTFATLTILVNSPVLPVTQVTIPIKVGGPAPVLLANFTDEAIYQGEHPKVLVRITNPGSETEPGGLLDLSAPSTVINRSSPAINAGHSHTVEIPLPPAKPGLLMVNLTYTSATGAKLGPISLSTIVHAPEFKVTSPANLVAGPGDQIKHTFKVTNQGNLPEQVLLQASADYGTATLEGPSLLPVGVNETKTVTVLHSVPKPSRGINATVVTLSLDLGPVHNWNSHAKTTVQDLVAPKLSVNPMPAPKMKLGSSLEMTVVATDNDAIEAINGTILEGTGAKSPLDLVQKNGAWQANLVLAQLGKQTMTFEALDQQGNPSRPLTIVVEVVKGLPPTIKPIGAAGGAVGPADKILVSVEDDFGIRTVNYSARQGNHIIAKDFKPVGGIISFDFHEFAAGPVMVRLEAHSLSGAKSALALNFTIVEGNAAFDTYSTQERGLPAGFVVPIPIMAAWGLRLYRKNRSRLN
jgi:hypothetical protein